MSGSKPGERRGGRQKGTPNKKTAEQKAAIKAAVEKAVGQLEEPFEGDSYAFLATLYKDKNLPLHVRLNAAKTAVAYERPRLSNVAMTTRSLDQLSDEEFFPHATVTKPCSSGPLLTCPAGACNWPWRRSTVSRRRTPTVNMSKPAG